MVRAIIGFLLFSQSLVIGEYLKWYFRHKNPLITRLGQKNQIKRKKTCFSRHLRPIAAGKPSPARASCGWQSWEILHSGILDTKIP